MKYHLSYDKLKLTMRWLISVLLTMCIAGFPVRDFAWAAESEPADGAAYSVQENPIPLGGNEGNDTDDDVYEIEESPWILQEWAGDESMVDDGRSSEEALTSLSEPAVDRGADWYPTLDMLLGKEYFKRKTYNGVNTYTRVRIYKNDDYDWLGPICVDIDDHGIHTKICLDSMVATRQANDKGEYELSLLLSNQVVEAPEYSDIYYGSQFQIILGADDTIRFRLILVNYLIMYDETFEGADVPDIDISDAEVSSIPAQRYTGQEITPQVTVKLDGVSLKKASPTSSGYLLLYEDNVEEGIGKVIVQGIGKYYGRKVVPFYIGESQASLSISSVSKCVMGKDGTISATYVAFRHSDIESEVSSIVWSSSDEAVVTVKDVKWVLTSDGTKASITVTISAAEPGPARVSASSPYLLSDEYVDLNVLEYDQDDPTDTDKDGLPDVWETHGVDTNGDGVMDLDLPKLGAVVGNRDLFVEVDSMEGRAPSQDALDLVARQFMNHGICLHIDAGRDSIDYVRGESWGELSGGESLDYADGFTVDFDDGTIILLNCDWSNTIDAHFARERRSVFRYCVFINRFSTDDFDPKSTGIAAGVPGQYFVCAICSGIEGADDTAVAGTFMHELGHTLGLQHGGSDGINNKPNYLSVMNYSFQFGLPGTSGFDRINYSDYELPAIDEGAIDERAGLDPEGLCANVPIGSTWYVGSSWYNVTVGTNWRTLESVYQPDGIDFNMNGKIDDGLISQNLNGKEKDGTERIEVFDKSINDWRHLIFVGGGIGDLGASSTSESPRIQVNRQCLDEWSLEQAKEEGFYSEEDRPVITASGMCGTSRWTLDSNGLLTIYAGQLASSDRMDTNSWPWSRHMSEIKAVRTHGDVHAGVSLRSMFNSYENITSIDLSSLDTSRTKDMSYMFADCNALESIVVGGWDLSSVTALYSIFDGCSSLKTLDVSGWDTGSVTDMNCAFKGCSSLKTLDVSGWDTRSVTNMSGIFCGCPNLESLHVSGWDVGSVTDMSAVFSGCSSLESLDISGWDTHSAMIMMDMFEGCTSLKTLDISGWDVGSVTDMQFTFRNCTSLEALDLSGWDTSSVLTLYSTFEGCSSLKTLDVSWWDVGSVTDMQFTFRNCTSLEAIDLSGWNPSSVMQIHSMFLDCSSLKAVDFSSWDTTGLEGFTDSTFSGCSSLQTFTVGDKYKMIAFPAERYDHSVRWQSASTGEFYMPYEIVERRNCIKDTYTREDAVSRIDISLCDAVIECVDCFYDGDTKLPGIHITYNGTDLIIGKDYTLSCADDCVDAGEYVITINGIDRFRGSKVCPFTIERAALADPDTITDLVFDGSVQQGVLEGDGYILSGTPYAINAGSYEATATLDANHMWSDGSTAPKSITWSIAPADIKDATVSCADQTYDGSAKTPAVTVTLSGITLVAGTDYVLSYANNVNAGTATVIATGRGNYSGTARESFAIVAREADTQDMYRLYNPNSGEHFYTASAKERDDVVRVGWRYEGIGWVAPTSGDPIYRLYNANGGEHHYTMDAAERDMLVGVGWSYEGVGWCSDPGRSVPLWREYNPNQRSCNHNYTTDWSEHVFLVFIGWHDEGIGWYGVASGK